MAQVIAIYVPFHQKQRLCSIHIEVKSTYSAYFRRLRCLSVATEVCNAGKIRLRYVATTTLISHAKVGHQPNLQQIKRRGDAPVTSCTLRTLSCWRRSEDRELIVVLSLLSSRVLLGYVVQPPSHFLISLFSGSQRLFAVPSTSLAKQNAHRVTGVRAVWSIRIQGLL